MSGGIEATDDAVGRDGHTHEHTCLNCGTPLEGPFCTACGQASHLHRSLMALWHDIAHGVFHFEGKVWHTLPMLAWRPGDLTRRYIHGERVKFVSPLALFLFSVFLLFAVFSTVGGPIRSQGTHVKAGVTSTGPDFKAELAKTRAQIATLERQRVDAGAKNLPTATIDKKLDSLRGDLTGLGTAAAMVDGVSPDELSLPADLNVHTGSSDFDDRIKHALKNPKLQLYKMQASAYKYSWALIPLSLPFMWLMFAWRRQYKLYDHAVFVTYSQSAVMLLLVVMALVAAVGMPTEWALFLVPVHFYRQLKQAYGLTRFSAIWRTIALLFFTSTVLILFAAGLVALGLLG
ncbi:MAG: DUF3667 domain-containing protein [Sphingomonadales bacterium]